MNTKIEDSKGIILNKYISQAGICSRRKAVEEIKAGYVSVNGRIVKDPALRVQTADKVKVRNKLVQSQELMYLVLNKPRGIVTTVRDERHRKTVIDLIDLPKNQRIYPIGRLDVNTTGVLLLTNDGNFAQQLAHPSYRVPKVYDVTLHKPLDRMHLDMIQQGVRLKDGIAQVNECFVLPGAKGNKVRIALHSGKNRIVRRIFEHIGYIIEKLDRISFAGISKKGIPVGCWRKLKPAEIQQIKHSK